MKVGNNDKEALLAALTGINASKRSYYPELKKKIKELENKNAQLDRAISSLESISRVLVNTTEGVDVLLQNVVQTVAELFETEYATITISEGADTQQMIYCAYGSPSGPMAAVPPSALQALIDAVIRQRQPVSDAPNGDINSATTLCVPMFRDKTLVGTICLRAREGGTFAKSDLSILQTLANQAAMAIENARLFEESRRLQAETKRLYEIALQQKEEAERKTRELEQARNELSQMQKEQILNQERNRIARELHDSVAQILTSIGLNLEWCRQQLTPDSPIYEKILYLKQLARNGIYEIRNTIFELSTINISEMGLVSALKGISQEFQRITGIEAKFAVKGEVRKLPLNVETAIYRVVQEALYNVFKHAQATRVDLELSFHPHHIEVQVTDNGVGIPEAVIQRSREGLTFGLKSMLDRVAELGGTLEIANLSDEGQGTRISACVPLREV